MRIAINGFGRIGRAVLRAGWSDPALEFVHVNDLTSPDVLAHLLSRDTVHGPWGRRVVAEGEGIVVDGTRVPVTATRDPAALPWRALGVDVVLECTGRFKSRSAASAHLDAGARTVLISAPGKGVDGTFVYGVNHDQLRPGTHRIVSNASCTTNCLAPLVKVLHDLAGIEHGLMTTIHSYTMDQNLLDAPHHKDLRRARAAALNMVPTTTGAAAAIGLVLPELDGKLDGLAVRVPTPDGSLVDLVARTTREVTQEALLEAYRAAAAGPMHGVLEVRDDALVSSDIVGNPHSCVVDAEQLFVADGRLVKLLAWYDNEWAFSNRMLDIARLLGGPA